MPTSFGMQILQAVFLPLVRQGDTSPWPTLQILHGVEDTDLEGQKLFSRHKDGCETPGVPQNDPAGQSTSSNDPAGQNDPAEHFTWVWVVLQK
jgi:hypothetical protein